MPTTFIVTGNPIDGLMFIGLFADEGDAISYAENHRIDGDWWIANLMSPEEFAEPTKPA